MIIRLIYRQNAEASRPRRYSQPVTVSKIFLCSGNLVSIYNAVALKFILSYIIELYILNKLTRYLELLTKYFFGIYF